MRKIHFYSLIISRSISRWKSKLLSGSVIKRRYLLLIFMSLLAVLAGIRIYYLSLTQMSISQGVVGVYTISNIPEPVTRLLSSSLVVLDKSGHPKPGLAESWRVNNNATQYTFTLRKNLFWSDGTPLKASDIEFSLPNISVSYPDDLTIVFNINESYSPLPSLLTRPVFKQNSLIGTGPYKVNHSERDRDRVIVTVLGLEPVKEGLPTVTIRFYQDEKTAKTAFWLGEVQSLIGMSDISDVRPNKVIKVRGFTDFQRIVAVFFNTKDPLLSDKNLRKALSYATPKIANEDYAKTSIPPFSWAFNPTVRDFLGHSDQAKSFLDKVKVLKDNPIVLTAPPSMARHAELIVKGWKSIGVPAVVRIESGNPQNFQAAILIEPILSDPDQYAMWHSTQPTNITHYKSDRVDKDLEDGRKSSDQQTRKDRYSDMQKVLADDSPATFLYFPKSQVVYLKKVEESLNKIIALQYP